MVIKPIDDSVSFGYSNKLKTLYKKGKLPVKWDFYGESLTKKNVTLEHLLPRCQGGKTELSNLVLATANKNQERGIKPLEQMLNWENAGRYLEQFRDVNLKEFNGNQYIQMILNTIKKLLQV